MTAEELLEKIREERPESTIHKVKSFESNCHGFYDVTVDMETVFFDTVIKHVTRVIPYPVAVFLKMSKKEQRLWIENH